MTNGYSKARGRTVVTATVIHADGTKNDLGVISINGKKPSIWHRLFGRKVVVNG